MQTKISQYYLKEMMEDSQKYKKIKGRYTYCLAHLNKPEYKNAYDLNKDIVCNTFLGELQNAHTAWFKLGHNFEVLREQVVNHYMTNQNIIWMAAVYQICMIECEEICAALDNFNLQQSNIEAQRKNFFMKEEAKADYFKRREEIISQMNNLDQQIKKISSESSYGEAKAKEKLKALYAQRVKFNNKIVHLENEIIAESKRLELVERKMETSQYGVELSESRKYIIKKINDNKALIKMTNDLLKEIELKIKFCINSTDNESMKRAKILEVLKERKKSQSKSLGNLNLAYQKAIS